MQVDVFAVIMLLVAVIVLALKWRESSRIFEKRLAANHEEFKRIKADMITNHCQEINEHYEQVRRRVDIDAVNYQRGLMARVDSDMADYRKAYETCMAGLAEQNRALENLKVKRQSLQKAYADDMREEMAKFVKQTETMRAAQDASLLAGDEQVVVLTKKLDDLNDEIDACEQVREDLIKEIAGFRADSESERTMLKQLNTERASLVSGIDSLKSTYSRLHTHFLTQLDTTAKEAAKFVKNEWNSCFTRTAPNDRTTDNDYSDRKKI